MAKRDNDLTNVMVSVNVSTMSKKVSSDFTQEQPTMTAYFTPETPADEKKLIDFGLTKYTSKEGEVFFCCKVSARIKIYKNGKSVHPVEISGLVENGIFTKLKKVNF